MGRHYGTNYRTAGPTRRHGGPCIEQAVARDEVDAVHLLKAEKRTKKYERQAAARAKHEKALELKSYK